jgi:ribonuclease-3
VSKRSRSSRAERPPRDELAAALRLPVDSALLDLALTHRSYAYENGGLPTNERLEFLGDSVLGLVVTERLFLEHPDSPEGQLAKLRASVVNMLALAEVSRGFAGGVGQHVLLGRGEEATGGRDKASILADTLEALLGAVFVERGLPVAAEIIRELFDPVLAEAAGRGAGLDWKTSLQELVASRGEGAPIYLVTESGPDHAKEFVATAEIAGRPCGTGTGGSKKSAEQQAAAAAFEALTALDSVDPTPGHDAAGVVHPVEADAVGTS